MIFTPISDRLMHLLAKIRQDRNGDWDDTVRGKAPHKPLILLVVADLIEAGIIRDNLITYDQRLLTAFDRYWDRCCPGRITNPLQPYWYLKGDGFWTMKARPGFKQVLETLVENGRIPPLRRAEELIEGACLDPELFALLTTDEGRKTFRNFIISTYFSGDVQQELARQHEIIVQSVRCENVLRRQLDRELSELFVGELALDAKFTEESRSLAFRSMVVEAYTHVCAVCSAHLRTPGGRSAVQAAHIVPFSVCRNNDPRNGLALCPLHHWAFDQGMLAIRSDYAVVIHAYARQLPADVGFLKLNGQRILLPTDTRMQPATIALEWHQKNVFGRVG